MPWWMAEARKIVGMCLQQRAENRKLQEERRKVLGELKEKFVNTLNGRAVREEVMEVEGIWATRRVRNEGLGSSYTPHVTQRD